MPELASSRPGRAALRAAAVGLLAAAAATSAAPASADTPDATDDAVRRYDAVVELSADGVAHVTLELDVDLGTEPGHGPYLTYLVKQRFDDTRDRVYRMGDFEVSSPTAPDEVQVEVDGAWLAVRIGDEGRDDVAGVHTYRVTYVVEGLVNSAEAFDLADDQLYLNIIGDRWEVPLEDLSVTVRGPVEVTDARCYTGADGVCASARVEAAAAVFTHDTLDAGEPWTVAVAFPAGTFGGVEPILQDRWSAGRAFALTPLTGGGAALATVLGLGGVARRVRRTGRDEQYAGLTPGLAPAAGQEATTAPRSRKPVAVRFTPPEGLRPGVIGTLVDERAEIRDVTATLVDLAVRGYLTVGPPADTAMSPDDDVDGGDGGDSEDRDAGDDWQLRRTGHDPDGESLLPFERTLLDGVFGDGPATLLSDLPEGFPGAVDQVRAQLYDDVTARGWFRGHPERERHRWAGRGAVVLTAGVVLTAALALLTSWALLGVPLVLVGLAMLLTAGAVPARTAAGTAVQVQAEGFRHYLATAEAGQLRFEDEAADGGSRATGTGQADLFSRYLPFAIAFGVAERWARVVGEAASAGRPVPDPTWYTGPTAFWVAGGTGTDLGRFTSAVDSAVTGPTTTGGATGSSGFSGVAGAGVGGGGGGTW